MNVVTFTIWAIVAIICLGAVITFMLFGKKAKTPIGKRIAITPGVVAQRDMLKQILDNQARSIFVVDGGDRLLFVNNSLILKLGKAPEETGKFIGKPLVALLGTDASRQHLQRVYEARSVNAPLSILDRKEKPTLSVLQENYIPLPDKGNLRNCVLVIEDDITALILEQERREKTIRLVVKTMMSLADARNPYEEEHSARVGRLSRIIAQEMKLDPVMVETAELAGDLMNLGKLLVPTDLLNRPDNLTPEELKFVRNCMRHAAEMLSGIEFEGPVALTLLQAHERYDGGGWPEGWGGEDILVTARIVAVANAFVAMTSPRAHRPSMAVDAALSALMQEAGTAYDPRVLTALINYLDTSTGRAEWEKPITGISETATEAMFG